jgi:hypothetical protein
MLPIIRTVIFRKIDDVEIDENLIMRETTMRRNIKENIFTVGISAILLMIFAVQGNPAPVFQEKKDSLEARLQRLEDKEEILLLLRNYGQFLDKRDFVSFSRLFSEKGGEWIGGMGKAKGSAAIRKLMEDTLGTNTEKAGPPNYHVFTNEMIVVKGNQANALSKWIFVVQGDGAKPQMMYLGHYEDSLVREDGRWKFLRRTVYADIPTDSQMSR